MSEISTSQRVTFKFGPYRLSPEQRRLWRGNDEVKLVGRAFDVLVALVKNAGSVVTHKQLMDLAWPGVYIDDSNLRVQVAALRNLLGDCNRNQTYIRTVPRRGYCFVAPVEAEEVFDKEPPSLPAEPKSLVASSLPPKLRRMIGRADDVKCICKALYDTRFVSIVGDGGVGKTVVALAVAHAVMEKLDGVATFVDLSAVISGEQVDAAVATAMGLAPQSENDISDVLDYARDCRGLIILDNCEHVIEAASAVAERLSVVAPGMFILTTSREALRAEGENVYLLPGLATPPSEACLSAEEALTWASVELFMERAAANGHRVPLLDDQVPTVVSICQRLDGIAMAIELAAGRVVAHGIDGTNELLNHRLKLMWQGRRGADRRQQTMNAMLDWSYNLLGDLEKKVLVRLSVFVGTFSVVAAEEVVGDSLVDPSQVAGLLSGLVEKSLVRTEVNQGTVLFRVLDMTRTYAAAKLEESGENTDVARRHARYVAACLVAAVRSARSPAEAMHETAAGLVGNLRAALQWSASSEADSGKFVELVGYSVPLMLSLSLLRECGRWCELALAELDPSQHGSEVELILWEGLAASTMFTRGNRHEAESSIERGLSLAKALGSDEQEIRLLSALHIFKARICDIHGMSEVSRRATELAARTSRDDLLAMTEWMQATTYHLGGDQLSAQRSCESALERAARVEPSRFNAFGYDHRVRGNIVLMRALWLRGLFDQAAHLAEEVLVDAANKRQPVALCIALIYTSTIAIWSHDIKTAENRIARLMSYATEHSLEPYSAVAVAMRGQTAVLRGDLASGISDIRSATAELRKERHRVLLTGHLCSLAEALGETGEGGEALAILDEAASRAECDGEGYLLPDLHRARGEILSKAATPDLALAERHLLEAIAVARQQSAKGWELRAAISMARLLINQGRTKEAASTIESAWSGMSEGSDHPIMRTAIELHSKAIAANMPG
ncbi:ATP-binding protein [Bradyrhizobium sp. CCBAU 25338]|uniref:ATP-binding protein n=1 Tax=Bradyrhizobium sp. CCBAU 25338 TaxID=1641877 RepID=UPI002304CD31|nr:winged helix-turn-helix domain-containing protein [Bradyrhizobium sp. CCBAU 25338]